MSVAMIAHYSRCIAETICIGLEAMRTGSNSPDVFRSAEHHLSIDVYTVALSGGTASKPSCCVSLHVAAWNAR